MALLLRLPALLVVLGPVLAGLGATLLPAFGYWPALGSHAAGLWPWRDLLAEPGIWRSAALTLWTGLASTALSLAATLLICGGLVGTRALPRVVRVLPPVLAVPHAAFALGFAFLIAPSGLFARMLSPWATGWHQPPDLLIVNDRWGLALVAGLVLKETPFLLLIATASLGQVDATRSVAVARSLGRKPFPAFLLAVWPRLYRQMRLPVAIVLAYSLSAVDMARILGPLTPPPLAVQVLRLAQDPDLSRLYVASAASCAIVVLTLLAFALWWTGEQAGALLLRRLLEPSLRPARRGWARAPATSAALAILGTSVLALSTLVLWSVAAQWRFPAAVPEAYSLAIWSRQQGLGPVAGTTAWLGAVACAAALLLAVCYLEGERRDGRGTRRKGWLLVLCVPLVLPDAGLMPGLRFALLTIGLDQPYLAVIVAHLLFVLPYVALSLAGPWRAQDWRYEAIARTLGHSPVSVLARVRLPLLLRPLATALALGFSVSFAQYLSTLMAGGGRVATLATETVSLATGGDRRRAAAAALVQAALPLAGFIAGALVPWLARRGRRGLEP